MFLWISSYSCYQFISKVLEVAGLSLAKILIFLHLQDYVILIVSSIPHRNQDRSMG